VPFAGGEVGGREQTAAGHRVKTALAGPMQGGVVLAGKYATITEEHEGRRVHVSTYASVKEAEARRLAKIVLSVRSCLEGWLAVPYPFQDLQLIEINDWGWGQAPPGIIFITREAFLTPARARLGEDTQVMASLTTRGINARIAHEVAHGWFPHVAKILRNEENWLSESFSDYVSAVCLERAMNDKRQARTFWEQQLRDWKSFAQQAGADTSVFLASHLTDREEDAYARYYLLYGKGPLVLQALRQELARQAGGVEAGDRLFFTWVRAIVQNFTYKPAETRHLIALLEQISGKPWQPWFERYVYGTETPRLD
jgi:aminopeptidase N